MSSPYQFFSAPEKNQETGALDRGEIWFYRQENGSKNRTLVLCTTVGCKCSYCFHQPDEADIDYAYDGYPRSLRAPATNR